MKYFYNRLKQTIKLPDYIFRSQIKKNALLYFKEFSNTRFGRLYLMAAVELKETKLIGYITTAFPVYNLKKGGELIWKR